MPNGGSINCTYCTYSRATPGRCDIFGTEATVFILCRSFRTVGQSHRDARNHWPMLKQLEPGKVYAIDNATPVSGAGINVPRVIYEVKPKE